MKEWNWDSGNRALGPSGRHFLFVAASFALVISVHFQSLYFMLFILRMGIALRQASQPAPAGRPAPYFHLLSSRLDSPRIPLRLHIDPQESSKRTNWIQPGSSPDPPFSISPGRVSSPVIPFLSMLFHFGTAVGPTTSRLGGAPGGRALSCSVFTSYFQSLIH